MTFKSASGACAVCLLLAGCVAPGYYNDSGYSSSGSSGGSYSEPSSDSPSYGDSRERSYVDRNGNTVFREPGETTVVEPDGDVTVIQRDRDGTRTIVGSDGSVQVRTPDGNCIGDC
jgi:hypothetical protein